MATHKKKSADQEAEQTISTQVNGTMESSESQSADSKLDKKIGKSREWTCLVYPESAPENWREILQQTFLEVYISPLHCRDTNPDGTPKKRHFHVVIAWAGPTTFSNARRIMETFGGVIEPRVVGSLRGICRYLCHLDNPEKAQYDPNEVVCYNGADWQTAINLKSDRYKSIEEMMEFCNKYRIDSFVTLATYAKAERKADWFRAICDGSAYIMREYCKSLKWQLEQDGCIETAEDIKTRIKLIDEELEGTNHESYDD